MQPEKVWDHWLTKPFMPGWYAPEPEAGRPCGCLVGERTFVMYGTHTPWFNDQTWRNWADGSFDSAGSRFDKLCERFGTERIQRAVRNRILTMMAFKTKAPSLVESVTR